MSKIKNVFRLSEVSIFDAPQKDLHPEIKSRLLAAKQAIDGLSDISNYFSSGNVTSLPRLEAERVMQEVDRLKQEFDRVYTWLQQTSQRTQ